MCAFMFWGAMGVLLSDERISVYMLGAVGGQLGSLLPASGSVSRHSLRLRKLASCASNHQETQRLRRPWLGPKCAHSCRSCPARPFSKADTMSAKRFRQLWARDGHSDVFDRRLARPDWA